MKKIKQNLNISNLTAFVIFFFSFILGLQNIYGVNLASNAFDNQEMLVWKYAALQNVFPYKDFSYPYGLINYFKNQSLLINIICLFIFPVVITLTYLILKKLLNSSLLSGVITSIYLLLIARVIGFANFDRYSIFYIVPLIFAYFIHRSKRISNKANLFFGIISGVLVSLFFDQGAYIAFTFLIMLFFNNVLLKERKNLFKDTFIQILIFGLGLVMGLIPLILILFKNGAVMSFFNTILYFKELTLLAKTPFFVFFFSPLNLFVFLTLTLSIWYLSVRLVLFKKINRFSALLMLALIMEALILENKSVIRSLSAQIVFPCLILLTVIFNDFIGRLKSKLSFNINGIVPFITLFLLLFSISDVRQGLHLNYLFPEYSSNDSLQKLLLSNSDYLKAVKYIKEKDRGADIFSYPGDPIFYILFKQKLPYYSAIYEASSVSAQDELIKYMKNNNVNFVIINAQNLAIQDGVPDYIRGSYVFSYILNNFEYVDQVDNFLILKKQNNSDNFVATNEYFKNLLSVDLGNIPRSEGEYKEKLLERNDSMQGDKSSSDINLTSDKLFLVLKGGKNHTDYSQVKIASNDNVSSIVRFKSCKNGQECIIDISKIPLFYKERVIKRITTNGDYKISLIKNLVNSNLFW